MTQTALYAPAMKQYDAFKEKFPGCMLLMRMGDFYEAFHDDAHTLAKAIGLVVTERNGTPMAGVPHHQLDNYLKKLVEKGIRVAIAEKPQA